MREPEKLAMRDACAQTLIEAVDQVPGLVVLDADVSKSTKTANFAKAHPERFFNVGIAEQNMVGIAAGMATTGMVPVVNSFSMLLSLRALDQIRQSAAYTQLNVKLVGHYGGYSAGPEGASHHAIEDLGIIRTIPNLVLLVPSDATETKQAVRAMLDYQGPVYLRLCRNPVPAVYDAPHPFEIGRGRELRAGTDLTLVATGIMVARSLEAAEQLAERGIQARVLAMPSIKPFDHAIVTKAARETGAMVAVEEHSIYGGLGSAVAEVLVETAPAPMERVGIRDRFAESGEYFELLDKYGLGVADIIDAARRVHCRKASN